jgi:hypothetical protein
LVSSSRDKFNFWSGSAAIVLDLAPQHCPSEVLTRKIATLKD